jgi:hypothetical protein
MPGSGRQIAAAAGTLIAVAALAVAGTGQPSLGSTAVGQPITLSGVRAQLPAPPFDHLGPVPLPWSAPTPAMTPTQLRRQAQLDSGCPLHLPEQ